MCSCSDDHDLLLFLCRSSAAAFMSFFWYLPHCGGARYGALQLWRFFFPMMTSLVMRQPMKYTGCHCSEF